MQQLFPSWQVFGNLQGFSICSVLYLLGNIGQKVNTKCIGQLGLHCLQTNKILLSTIDCTNTIFPTLLYSQHIRVFFAIIAIFVLMI